MRSRYPSDKLDQFVIRMPDGLRERLKAVAKSNRRTMNAEVIYHLENALFAQNEKPAAQS